jgi:LytS/YehU family sensor histidine kinase
MLEVADTGVGPGSARSGEAVADTGVGPGSARSGEGFGMNQVRERLAALHGAAAGIDFVAAPGGGSRTILRLPLQS